MFDDEPDNVLDHPTLQPGHVDGEEGPGHQHQGVEGEEARLHAPHPGDHDLGITQHEDTSLHAPHPGDHNLGTTQHEDTSLQAKYRDYDLGITQNEDTSLQATKSLDYDLGTTQHADAGIHVPESRDHDPLLVQHNMRRSIVDTVFRANCSGSCNTGDYIRKV